MNSPQLRLVPCLCCLLLAASPSQRALGQTLAAAEYYAEASAGTEGLIPIASSDQKSDSVPLNLNVDLVGQYSSGDHPYYSYDMQAQSEAFGGNRPMVTASAEAHGVWLDDASANDPLASLQASAGANITYSVRVIQTAPPPSATSAIPATISLLGDVTGIGIAGVSVRYASESFPLAFDRIDQQEGHNSFDRIVRKNLVVGNEMIVYVVANARAIESFEAAQVGAKSSQSVADPLFELDQATFDANMGQNTFPLASYYAFEYSPGTLPPQIAPAPLPGALLGLGLVLGLRRLRRAKRSRTQ